MVGSFIRLAAATALCVLLAACASTTPRYSGGERSTGETPLQCVPYARDHSKIALYGDAYTWWDQADGHYARTASPTPGAVLVLYNYAGPARAHLAVVRDVINEREIRVDHANWLDDGAIYTNDPVADVSANNDWSLVRVFNIKTGAWGSRNYQVQGFIGPGPADTDTMHIAQAPAVPKKDPISDLLSEDLDDDGAGN